jgi:putative transposase
MATTTRFQRKYDHRLRELVRATGNIEVALKRGVPPSTARGWVKATQAEVVTIDVADMNILQLQQEVLALRKRIRRLLALLRLVMVLLKIAGFSLANARIPDQQEKHKLLRAIERSRSVLPLRIVLGVLRLSHSRYHSWKREEECGLEDMPSCPRVSPHQLTTAEIATIKEMVISEEYRHVPTGTLALLAQRLGKVFASPSTWYRLVRLYHWRRPRKRVHPSKPKAGIRASRPNKPSHQSTRRLPVKMGRE